jgi:hypothetical protein
MLAPATCSLNLDADLDPIVRKSQIRPPLQWNMVVALNARLHR